MAEKVGTLNAPLLGIPGTPRRDALTQDQATPSAPDSATDRNTEKHRRTALEAHISFFETLGKNDEQTGVVQAKGTRIGLGKLGLGFVSRSVGGHLLTLPFSIPQNKSLFADRVQIDRINEGVRGAGSDAGIYDAEGNVNANAFKSMWKEFAGDKGYLNDKDVAKLVHKKPVNALEFGLLMELAGKITDKGERVLTLDTMLSFYDGSLFADLAKAREEGTLLKPTGVLEHDGPKQVAKDLASLALHSGGAEAGEGAKAIYAANLTIDDDASLAYQQMTKSLGGTLAGAFKAMCPAGKG